MNISRISTLSLGIVFAVFALGYNPSFADNPANGNHPHGGGGSGDEKTETVFLVEMQPGDMGGEDGLFTSAGVACGSTEGELHLGVVFEELCAVTSVNVISPSGAPILLRLWYVQVNLRKSTVQIAFRTDLSPDPDGVYVTDRLPVTIIPDPDVSSSAFTVDVDLFDLTVEKNHNPGKGDLVGPFAIGHIVYTPID